LACNSLMSKFCKGLELPSWKNQHCSQICIQNITLRNQFETLWKYFLVCFHCSCFLNRHGVDNERL
jgi:hypothetical protein